MFSAERRTTVANFLLFQGGWFICVLGAAWFGPDLGRALAQIGIGWVIAMAILLPITARTAPEQGGATYRWPVGRR